MLFRSMAYNNLCTATAPGTSCTRIPYFSNPSVNYLGNATGVGGANDNKSALEASRANISSLETTLSAKVFVNAYTFASGEQSDIIAISSVTNSTTFVYQSGSAGSWRSGGSITLAPGFRAAAGSSFRAYSDGCTALRPAPVAAKEITAIAKQQPIDNKSVQVQPNPFVSRFDVFINSNQTSAKAQVVIYNALGMVMKGIEKINLSNGLNKISVDGSTFAKGVYMVEIITGETKTVKKIVKM